MASDGLASVSNGKILWIGVCCARAGGATLIAHLSPWSGGIAGGLFIETGRNTSALMPKKNKLHSTVTLTTANFGPIGNNVQLSSRLKD